MSQRRSALLLPAFALVAARVLAGPAAAADECLAKPNKPSPPGEHWYYRFDNDNNRRCWYLKAQAVRPSKSATVSTNAPKASAAPKPPAAPKPAEPPAAKPPPSIAAVPAAKPAPATAAIAAPPSADAPSTPQPTVRLRWPETDMQSYPSEARTETVAMGWQVTAPIDAQPRSTADAPADLPRESRRAEATTSPKQTDARAGTSASLDIARHLIALVLMALALLVIAGPLSHLAYWLRKRTAGRRSNIGHADFSWLSKLRGPFSRPGNRPADTAWRRDGPQDDLARWSGDFASAWLRLAEATHAYRSCRTERIRLPDHRVRGVD